MERSVSKEPEQQIDYEKYVVKRNLEDYWRAEDGSGSVTWADGMRMCSALDSGDGAGPWRMPTQKELMQLHINGIANLTVAGGTLSELSMWSSSVVSATTFNAWSVALAYGSTNHVSRDYDFHGVFCVR